MITQEDRSFDSYFGTFPGADGIPMQNGKPNVCVPDPLAHRCVRPGRAAAEVGRVLPDDRSCDARAHLRLTALWD